MIFFKKFLQRAPTIGRGKFLDPVGAKEKIGGFFGRENPAIFLCIGKRPQATWGCEDDFEIRPFTAIATRRAKPVTPNHEKIPLSRNEVRGALPRRGESYDLRGVANRTI